MIFKLNVYKRVHLPFIKLSNHKAVSCLITNEKKHLGHHLYYCLHVVHVVPNGCYVFRSYSFALMYIFKCNLILSAREFNGPYSLPNFFKLSPILWYLTILQVICSPYQSRFTFSLYSTLNNHRQFPVLNTLRFTLLGICWSWTLIVFPLNASHYADVDSPASRHTHYAILPNKWITLHFPTLYSDCHILANLPEYVLMQSLSWLPAIHQQ